MQKSRIYINYCMAGTKKNFYSTYINNLKNILLTEYILIITWFNEKDEILFGLSGHSW
jgi:hypothetical protein